MAIIRVCDFPSKHAPHEPTVVVTASVGKVSYSGEFCKSHADEVAKALLAVGVKPTKAQVGHTRRGAYVTASGRAFTARDARTWLKDAGFEVSNSGKLTEELLGMYAQAH